MIQRKVSNRDLLMSKHLTKDLKKYPHLSHFLEHCCVCRKYFFASRNACDSGECEVCRQPRLPAQIFALFINFLTLYEKLNSQVVNFSGCLDTACPISHQSLVEESLHAGTLSGETVHEICSECLKSRCVYAAKYFTKDEVWSSKSDHFMFVDHL